MTAALAPRRALPVLRILAACAACAGPRTAAARPSASSAPPHPAVVRIVVDDGGGGFSLGSGVLVDVRDRFGLVVTNWHVVRDAQGAIQVHFADGFQSAAQAAKLDADWDLAALVIWRPPAAPAPIAESAPRLGDRLTICGYGPGIYRAASGRCTRYYAPRVDYPLHVVELDVEARQGDSGGPIFNERGEVAGILFGAGSGTTLGSYGGRVQWFLASLAPDIGAAPREPPGQARAQFAATAGTRGSSAGRPAGGQGGGPSGDAASLAGRRGPSASVRQREAAATSESGDDRGGASLAELWRAAEGAPSAAAAARPQRAEVEGPIGAAGREGRGRLLEHLKSALAAIGLIALSRQALRAVQ